MTIKKNALLLKLQGNYNLQNNEKQSKLTEIAA